MSVVLLSATLCMCGCGNDNPLTATVPRGEWAFDSTDANAGVSVRGRLSLDAYSGGEITDTFLSRHSGSWSVDSTRSVELQLGVVGDGYQRITEITSSSASGVDTTLGYWLFFEHGDTLLYYRGMRFEGSTALLQGRWTMSEADRDLVDPFATLEFSSDSVAVMLEHPGENPTRTVYHYTSTRDSLRIDGLESLWGNRYEVFAASALYITSFSSRRYLPVN